MNYDGYFLHALARLQDERRYRVFADLERIAGRRLALVCVPKTSSELLT
jgi:hypothetical protein